MLTIVNKEKGEVTTYCNLNFLDLDSDEIEHFISTTLNHKIKDIKWFNTKQHTIINF